MIRTNSKQKYVIVSNLKRRQLNDFQKAELAFKLKDIERKLAKQRQIELAGTRPNKGNTLSSIEDKVVTQEKGRTVNIVSKKAGVFRGTYE
jgi:hypothetical protein